MKRWLLLLLLLLPTTSGAQFNEIADNNLMGSNATLLLQPSYPEPFEIVSISLEDFRSSSRSNTIEWYRNGEIIAEFSNQREIAIEVGDIGSSNLFEAVLTNENGVKEAVRTSINPIYLDIIIEPQTHIPDFYRGRAIPSTGSIINATALLEGISTNANNLLFTWQVNNAILHGGSIRGGSFVSFPMPRGSLSDIIITVSDLKGTIIAKRAFSISSTQPKLLFYEINTLYGTTLHPINTLNLIANTATFRAEPYYIDSQVYNQPDISEWEIGREVTSPTSNPYEVTLQRTDAGNGRVPVSFHVRSTDNVLQGVESAFTLQY